MLLAVYGGMKYRTGTARLDQFVRSIHTLASGHLIIGNGLSRRVITGKDASKSLRAVSGGDQKQEGYWTEDRPREFQLPP